jgi:predicted RecB family nuclease
MHLSDTTLLLSATDLSKYLACNNLPLLDRLTALGLQPKPPKYDDPALEALFARGLEHEQAYLDALKANGLKVIEFQDEPARRSPDDWRHLAAQTTEAMRSGPDVIYQGTLFDAPWLGKPDFLRRVDTPSALGAWSYEVVDTKLAREAKAGAVLQITFYTDLLARLQSVEPEEMVLALGGPDAHPERFRYTDFAAYYRSVRVSYLEPLDVAEADAVGECVLSVAGDGGGRGRCTPQ